jgi:hypothetical protein
MSEIRNVFLGFTNIASAYNDIKYGFSCYGVNTRTAIFDTQDKLVQGQYDLIVHDNLPGIIRKLLHFDVSYSFARKAARKISYEVLYPLFLKSFYTELLEKEIQRNDAFVFLWNSFYRDFSDLETIHKNKKKIVQIFCGDDVRWYYGIKQEFESLGLPMVRYDENYMYKVQKMPLSELRLRLNRIKYAEKYADIIFNKREQAQICTRPFYHYPMIINPENFAFSDKQREKKPLVLHAPSNSAVKGTDYVLQAVGKLKSEGLDFDFKLIQNIPNKEAVKLFADSDIIIDQLFIPGGGRLSSEGLALGKVVISCMYYDKYFQADYYNDCPIIDANIETIYPVLKETILNYNLRKQLPEKGRDWAERNLDVKVFCKKILDVLSGTPIPTEYTPTFFKEKFVPESPQAEVQYRKYRQFIK